MLFKNIIIVYFDKHTKVISKVCGTNFVMLKQVVHIINTVLIRVSGVFETYAILMIIEQGP